MYTYSTVQYIVAIVVHIERKRKPELVLHGMKSKKKEKKKNKNMAMIMQQTTVRWEGVSVL